MVNFDATFQSSMWEAKNLPKMAFLAKFQRFLSEKGPELEVVEIYIKAKSSLFQ